jgi:hypothetical protein
MTPYGSVGGYRRFGRTARCRNAEDHKSDNHHWENLKTYKRKFLLTLKGMVEILRKISDVNNDPRPMCIMTIPGAL